MIKYSWQYFTLQNETNIFSHSDLNKALETFWGEVMNRIDSNQVVAVVFQFPLPN
jgi:hypothetical protein